MSNPEQKDRGLAWVLGAGVIGFVVLGAVYLRFRMLNEIGSLAAHANLGNALAPAVAFLTLLAVVAALWSVQIQRTELALQRQELRETREEMVEQRKQFERTARAQERLAASQLKLAEAQVNANREAACLRLAQHSGTIATLQAALGNMDAASAIALSTNQNTLKSTESWMTNSRGAVRDRIARETKAEGALQILLTQGAIHAPLTVNNEGTNA